MDGMEGGPGQEGLFLLAGGAEWWPCYPFDEIIHEYTKEEGELVLGVPWGEVGVGVYTHTVIFQLMWADVSLVYGQRQETVG
jgi:hypothetical protein